MKMQILLIRFSISRFYHKPLAVLIYSCVNPVILQSKYYEYPKKSHALVLEMKWFVYLIQKCVLLIPFLFMILQEAQTLLSSLTQFTSVGFLFKSWSWELSTWTLQLWVRVLESDIAPQWWPWSDQSQQRMSSRYIINNINIPLIIQNLNNIFNNTALSQWTSFLKFGAVSFVIFTNISSKLPLRRETSGKQLNQFKM